MHFPERSPLLALYLRIGWVLILLGLTWATIGAAAGRFAARLTADVTSVAPWQLPWWERFGWGYGLALAAAGVIVLLLRALRKRGIEFGDRVRRQYK